MLLRKKIALFMLPIAAVIVTGCETTHAERNNLTGESGFSKEVFNVEELTCWDLSTLAEEDAGYAATLLYGYAQGKAGDATQTPSKIEYALGEISTKCAGSPDMLVLDAFK